ncbi:MAG: hypothetical protein EAZ89_21510, partial [Bacteroidetes bacterium]
MASLDVKEALGLLPPAGAALLELYLRTGMGDEAQACAVFWDLQKAGTAGEGQVSDPAEQLRIFRYLAGT